MEEAAVALNGLLQFDLMAKWSADRKGDFPVAVEAARRSSEKLNAWISGALKTAALSPPRPAREDVEGRARELLAAEIPGSCSTRKDGWLPHKVQAVEALRAIVKALSGSPS